MNLSINQSFNQLIFQSLNPSNLLLLKNHKNIFVVLFKEFFFARVSL